MESLARLIDRAGAGNGQVALIAGEAGVGKSRLVKELRAGAAAQGLLTFQGSCFEQDRGFAFAPLVDLLRAHVVGCTPEEAVRRLGQPATELARLVPEIFAGASGQPSGAPVDPEQESRRIFNSALRFFTDLAARQPLILVIEDLHWGDDTSLEFLLYLARRIPAHRILLVMTYRSNEVHPSLGHFLASLDRERTATELLLDGLSKAEVAQALRAILETKTSLPADFLETVYSLTEGNPFFVEEVLKSLASRGDLLYSDSGWSLKPSRDLQAPRSVNDAVQQRTRSLSDTARAALAIASVAGQRFDFAVIQRLTRRDERELLRALKELVAGQLVVEESADHFVFRHALTRQAIYSQLLARERKNLHREIAEAITAAGGPLENRAEDLSYHWYEAEEWGKALEYCQMAGEKARRLYSPRAAVQHFTRAMDAARALSLPLTVDLLRGRGLAYATLGEFKAALSDDEAALRTAQATGDSRSEWQVNLDLGLLWCATDYNRAGHFFQRALDMARGMEDQAALATSLNRLGNWHVNVSHVTESETCHREALAIFEHLQDERGIADTLDLLGMANVIGGDLFHAGVFYRRAIAAFQKQDNREGLASSLTTMSSRSGIYQNDALVPVDRQTDSFHDNDEALKIVRDIGWRVGEAYTLWVRALGLGSMGEYAEALKTGDEALAIAKEIGHMQWASASHFALGATYADIFAWEPAHEHLTKALALARQVSAGLWVGCSAGYLAVVYRFRGKFDDARKTLEEALTPETPMDTMGWRSAWCSAAELAFAESAPDLALDIADRLVATCPEGPAGNVIPRVSLVRGEALAALGRFDKAEAALLGAMRVARDVEMHRIYWRIHLSFGHVYQSQRRRDEALTAFKNARNGIEAISVKVPEGRLRDNFVREATALLPRIHAPTPLRKAREESGGLTAREREVALLVAEGKSNRAIGEQLVVTERTAETHVANVMSKLGLNTRAQIAAWVASRRLSRDG